MKNKLNKLSRKVLNDFMASFGEDGSEWDSKADLISDIIRFGRAADALSYAGE